MVEGKWSVGGKDDDVSVSEPVAEPRVRRAKRGLNEGEESSAPAQKKAKTDKKGAQGSKTDKKAARKVAGGKKKD